MSATTTRLHHARRASVFHPSMLEFVELVGTWLSRARQRRDLAKLTAEHLADIGVSQSAARHESEKPFWRA